MNGYLFLLNAAQPPASLWRLVAVRSEDRPALVAWPLLLPSHLSWTRRSLSEILTYDDRRKNLVGVRFAMLIRFSVANFRSFDHETELSMVKGLQRKHPGHIIKAAKSGGSDLLRAAVVYGANAAGKSNLVGAIEFAQKLIVDGTAPGNRIPVVPFKLREEAASKPGHFEFELRVGTDEYVYGFEVSAAMVESEWLYKVVGGTEQMLFERTTKEGKASVAFGPRALKKDDQAFAKHVARGTRGNQLYLSECRRQESALFKDVYEWFSTSLVVIFPNSRFVSLEKHTSNKDFRRRLTHWLSAFDTGIEDIETQEVALDSEQLDISDEVKERIAEDIGTDKAVMLTDGRGKRFRITSNKDGTLSVTKIVTRHQSTGDSRIRFEMDEESDGTQRLFDLVPALAGATSGDTVLFIDELDRSLHPALSRRFISAFLERKRNAVGQLVVTTHESSLLDLDLLRRDEIWFVEKDSSGASTLYSLEEFAPRYDRDVRRGYLQGRFGAIPILAAAANLFEEDARPAVESERDATEA